MTKRCTKYIHIWRRKTLQNRRRISEPSLCQMQIKKRKFDTPFDTDFEKSLYTNAFWIFNHGFDSSTGHHAEKALETYSRAFLLLYQLYSHVLRTILRENITTDFNIFPRAVRFYGANWQRIGNGILPLIL